MVRRKDFKSEVYQLAKEIGVKVMEIHMRKMRNKWASCSSRGRLTFDPAILRMPDRKRYEIVLHELLHLRYPNDGRMFKTRLSTYLEKALSGGASDKR
ncbi:MAG: hypothetical protein DRN16_02850 [Thermoplasmata archaeon]|nr:MAG: hypothetical protein DRN16_02850 [Thermoplasmata archaeon]